MQIKLLLQPLKALQFGSLREIIFGFIHKNLIFSVTKKIVNYKRTLALF